MIGIVAFSYGLRGAENEPNPCNAKLADEVERLLIEKFQDGPAPVIVSQWEIAKKLKADGVNIDHIVYLRPDGQYLSTKDVWEAAKRIFSRRGVRGIHIVAQPFIHHEMIRRMATKDGFTVLEWRMGKIGHDPESICWWTKGPWHLMLYVFLCLFGYQGQYTSKGA